MMNQTAIEIVLAGWESDQIAPIMADDDWIVCRRRDSALVRASLRDVLAMAQTADL